MCECSTRLLSFPGRCPSPRGLQARAPLITRSCCGAGGVSAVSSRSPGDSSQPWRVSHCSAEFWSSHRVLQQLFQGGASSWEHLPAVPTAGTHWWQSSSCQLWLGKVSWECLTKLKGKVLCKKTQPPACSCTSNHLQFVVSFLLVSVLIKKHKLKNCKVLQYTKQSWF